ncbi:hypothetical protein OIU91_41105 (plasmid) [Streptomyces sp. NBC_01456]|uniref:hypothetical protein n=1 Tax=unclassified Streptomyces TaxID=2593676 RepID=UPI002E31C798|nr:MULTISPECIES: hypothetical protein [unclassified Streptomyces]
MFAHGIRTTRSRPAESARREDEKPLATLDIGTTDPHLVAALLVTAAQHHRTAL